MTRRDERALASMGFMACSIVAQAVGTPWPARVLPSILVLVFFYWAILDRPQ